MLRGNVGRRIALAVLAVMVGLVAIPAGNIALADLGEAQRIVTELPGYSVVTQEITLGQAQPENVLEEDVPQWRVVFYSAYGEVLAEVDITDGDYLIEPEGPPQLEGHRFLYWYNALEEGADAYPFGAWVTGPLELYPYYEAVEPPQTPEAPPQPQYTEPERSIDPAELDRVASGILNVGSTPSAIGGGGEQGNPESILVSNQPSQAAGVTSVASVASSESSRQPAETNGSERTLVASGNKNVMDDSKAQSLIEEILSGGGLVASETGSESKGGQQIYTGNAVASGGNHSYVGGDVKDKAEAIVTTMEDEKDEEEAILLVSSIETVGEAKKTGEDADGEGEDEDAALMTAAIPMNAMFTPLGGGINLFSAGDMLDIAIDAGKTYDGTDALDDSAVAVSATYSGKDITNLAASVSGDKEIEVAGDIDVGGTAYHFVITLAWTYGPNGENPTDTGDYTVAGWNMTGLTVDGVADPDPAGTVASHFAVGVSGDVAIAKRPITLDFGSYIMTLGDKMPAAFVNLTIGGEGLAPVDEASIIEYALDGGAIPPTAAGRYNIVCANASKLANYDITQEKGTLTVNAKVTYDSNYPWNNWDSWYSWNNWQNWGNSGNWYDWYTWYTYYSASASASTNWNYTYLSDVTYLDPQDYQPGDQVVVKLIEQTQIPVAGLSFAGWEVDGAFYPANSTFKMPDTNVTIKAVWTMSQYTLTVQHRTHSGRQVAPDETFSYRTGEVFTVQAVQRSSYRADNAPVTGVMPSGNLTVTVYYTYVGSDNEETATKTSDATKIETATSITDPAVPLAGPEQMRLYTLHDDDIPLAAIVTRTVGECFE